MEIGFTQNEIDEMDIIWHMKMLAHRQQSNGTKENKPQSNKPVTIDQIIG